MDRGGWWQDHITIWNERVAGGILYSPNQNREEAQNSRKQAIHNLFSSFPTHLSFPFFLHANSFLPWWYFLSFSLLIPPPHPYAFINILQGLVPMVVFLSGSIFFWKGYLLSLQSWDSGVCVLTITVCQKDSMRKVLLSSHGNVSAFIICVWQPEEWEGNNPTGSEAWSRGNLEAGWFEDWLLIPK